MYSVFFMKLLPIIILILLACHFSSACSSSRYTKHEIPMQSLNEVIEKELALNNEIIEVRVNNRIDPIQIIGFESDNVFLGLNSDEQEVKILIKDIEQAWTRDSLPDGKSDSEAGPIETFLGFLLKLLGTILFI